MAAGNFSNGGLDTFDAAKRYIGIRLQQGVPLLDRDWNELEDIRRWTERTVARTYLGDGCADEDSFRVAAPGFAAPNDVRIFLGSYLFDGYHLPNDGDVLFSEQGDRVPLPDTLPGGDVVKLVLQVIETRVDSTDDPDLANGQDVNMETCVRDRLDWSVVARRYPPDADESEPGTIARIVRPPGTTQITDDMIQDLRTTGLSLAGVVHELDLVWDRIEALEQTVVAAQADIESLKVDVGHLFWDIEVSAPAGQALFGEKVVLSLRAIDRLGTAVEGATLSLATDWGMLQPSVVTTGSDGRASALLVGVMTEATISGSDIARLSQISTKVSAATLANPGAIEYAKIRFEPDEMALVSRYTPASHLEDLISDLPDRPIVAQPVWRTATVTIHAKEGATVRGVGSIQISFGQWVRDWALTKLRDVVANVQVGSRIGDVMRRGVVDAAFDHTVVAQVLPATLQSISDQTQMTVKQSLFADPDLHDDDLRGTGVLGQVISQEATAAIGAMAHRAISTQLDQFTQSDAVTVDEAAQRDLTQQVSQITAGFAQSARQVFSVAGRLG